MRIQKTMLRKFRPHPGLIACALAWGWSSVQATSLGPIDNPVFIGKPFSVSLPVGEAEDSLGCVSVQLSYGNAPVSSTFQLRNNILKIRSSTPVNEPLLTLDVSADCENPITRSYTLFAEMPVIRADKTSHFPSPDGAGRESSIDAPDNRRANNQNFFGIESSPNTDYIIVQPLPEARPQQRRIALERGASNSKPLPSAPASAQTTAAAGSVNTGSNAAPRLELDNADILEKDPHLRLAYELLSAHHDDPKAREAARARWQAFSRQMTDLEDAQALAADTNALAAQRKAQEIELRMQRSEEQIAKLQAQLAQEKSGNNALRYTLYGVLGLLLFGLSALAAYRWRLGLSQRGKKRSTKELAWWQQYSHTGAAPLESEDIDLPIGAAPATNLTGYVHELPVPEVAFDSVLSSDFGESTPKQSHTPAGQKAAKSSLGGIEGLQEAQEQADFFVALGEYERAEKLMRRYIDRNPETSPMAYLNLLGIYHAAHKESAFEVLREHFNQTFNAQIPDFARFKSDPRDLSSYPDTLEQLQQLWGRSEVIRYIGHLLFRQPHQAKSESAFAPMAYRELLMLYGIATETSASAEDLSHIQSVTAGAAKWLQQPDTIILNDDDHPATVIQAQAAAEPQTNVGFTGEFNTGPSPLDKEGWTLDTTPPPKHLNIDFNLDTSPPEIDLELPEGSYHTGGPTTINLGVEPLAFDKPKYSDSNLDISLSEVEQTLTAPLHPKEDQHKPQKP